MYLRWTSIFFYCPFLVLFFFSWRSTSRVQRVSVPPRAYFLTVSGGAIVRGSHCHFWEYFKGFFLFLTSFSRVGVVPVMASSSQLEGERKGEKEIVMARFYGGGAVNRG